MQTLETFLDADGNVAGTAQRLFTHRHTVRYRLERVRDLTGLDVSSTDGRERLGLGLKAMRVLGHRLTAGPGHRGRRRRRARPPRAEGPLEPPAQKISGHHGSTAPRNAVAASASAPGRSSPHRPAAASAPTGVPPR